MMKQEELKREVIRIIYDYNICESDILITEKKGKRSTARWTVTNTDYLDYFLVKHNVQSVEDYINLGNIEIEKYEHDEKLHTIAIITHASINGRNY